MSSCGQGSAEAAVMSVITGYHRRKTGRRRMTAGFLAICVFFSAAMVYAQRPRETRVPRRPVRGQVDRSVRRIGSSVRESARAVRDSAPRFDQRTGRQYGAEFRKRFERNFRVTGRPDISIVNEFGSVRVRPWSSNQVRVRADIVARAPEAALARQLAHNTIVDAQASSGLVVIRTRYPDTRRSGQVLVQTNYDVSVPARSDLYLENRFGDVDVRGINGKIESVCSHGRTRVEELRGTLKVVSENGSVLGINLASTTRIDAQFGRVDLREMTGWTTVHSRYGPVTVSSASSECDVQIACDSDDIELILPADADPRMDVQTTFGKIRSDIPLTVQTVGNSSTGRRVSNSPQRIDLTSSMGDIAVKLAGRSADAPTGRLPGVLGVGPDEVPRTAIKYKEVELARGSVVRIESGRGDIRIAGWDRNVLGVAATRAGEPSARTEAPGEQIPTIPEVRVESAADGAQVAWISPAPAEEGVRAGLDIKVPSNTALEITNSDGDAVIDSVYGKLNISNDHGNIKVMNLKPLQQDCSLRCSDGNISLLIPEGSQIDISAAAEDGSIESAIPLEGYVSRRKSSLTGSTGEPGAAVDGRVELKVTRGRIVIN